ncbi:MAG: tetrathionate reductase family octaheme c-type cytochrome [Burkholderiaceae bacterium]|nr:tetrathionate reductase family octaheme c-type cytochrome [Burkholderiaceae bacterium]
MLVRHFRWVAASLIVACLALFGTIASATTADHSKFKELQQDFASGTSVTKACLQCHGKAADQVMHTTHWTWEYVNPVTKQVLGKKHLINNFCIAIETNEAHCATCHVGYGYKDRNFDFTNKEAVDCLVCHDTTGAYRKQPGMAGEVVTREMEFPPGSGRIVKPVDLRKVAQKVGPTSRDTCGTCHFRGGGGDGVKHGDMDSSLAAPDEDLDIHMNAIGLDFKCSTCHMTKEHRVPGSRYAPTARDDKGRIVRGNTDGRNPTTCESCHDNAPHRMSRLNTHATKLACQTCHVPKFARGGIPTKMSWDWSTAGRLDPQGEQFEIKDDKGHKIYESREGSMILGENVVPEYRWFNGIVEYTLMGQKIDPTRVVQINRFLGSPDDGKSLIWPVKVMRGKQPYDVENLTLVKPETARLDDTAYWKNLDWEKAIEFSMRSAGQPFSGKVGFVSTEMYWPITHMVAPKDKGLGCADCHSAESRLAGLAGIYMPGYSANRLLDRLGWGLVALTALGVVGHGLMRFVAARKRK